MVYNKIQVLLNKRLTVAAIFFVALGLRLANLFFMNVNDPFFLKLRLDHARYDDLAMLILKQGFRRDHAFYQDPLYPYILSMIYSILGHSYIAVFILQSILASVSCVLLYLIGKFIFDRRIGLIAAAFLAVYGPDIFYSSMLTKVPFSIFFLLLSIYLLIRFGKDGGYRKLFLSGVLIGLAAATRGNFLIIIPLFLIFVIVSSHREGYLKVVPCIIMLLGFFLSIFPWTIHNYIVDTDMILINSAGGPNFYLGNNLRSTGTYTNLNFLRPSPKYERIDFTNEAIRRTGNQRITPSEVSSFWYGESFRYIKANPGHFARLFWKKTGLFFNYFEIPDNRDLQFQRRYSPILRYNPFTFGFLGPLAISGILFSMRDWRRYWFLSSIIVVYSVGTITFFIFSRYRMPIVPLMLLFSSYFIVKFKERITKLNLKKLVVPTVLLFLAFFYTGRKIHDTDFYRYHSRVDLGYNLMETGKCDQAIQEIKTAMNIKPNFRRGYVVLSECYLKKKQLDEAAKVLISYLEIDPNDTWTKKRLASLHLK